MIALLAAVTMHWLVLNDIHVNPYDHRTHAVRGSDSNDALVRSAISEMHARVPDAKVILLGGDFLAHHFHTLAREQHQDPYVAGRTEIEALARRFDEAFPRAHFLVALGNNDDPCGDYRSEIGGPYARSLAKAFAPLVDRDGASPRFVHDFADGGYYTARLPGGLRAVVLNSVLWSFVFRGSCQVSALDPGEREMQWLARTISSGDNVLLMHIPPGYDGESTTMVRRLLAVPFLWSGYDRSFRDALRTHAGHVAFSIAAHTHRYDVRVPGDTPMLIASSLSPIYLNNPAFYELDIEDGRLRDVVPFVYDLRSHVWRREPSFDTWYGVNGLSTSTLRHISARIASDAAYRARWIEAYDVWSWRIGDVSDYRWQTFQCAQTVFGANYARCAGTQRRSNVLLVAGSLLAALAAALVALGIAMRMRRRRA